MLEKESCLEKRAAVRKVFKPRTSCRISVSYVHGCVRAADSYHNPRIPCGVIVNHPPIHEQWTIECPLPATGHDARR